MKARDGKLLAGRCLIAVAALLPVVVTGAAVATPLADLIAQDVDTAVYQHYHLDLLYTHMGDNRGFGPEHDLARDNIVATLSAMNLTVAMEPFVYSGTTYYNIVATQIGRDLPGRIHVLGAHFDSVNNPGADDNGTGTALVMEAARVLSQYRASRTIKFVLFDREEQGLVGSGAFVSAHAAENIVQAVVADMVGHDSGAYAMDIYGTNASATVVNGVSAAIGSYGGTLGAFLNFGTYSFSDHWPFESAGIPACVLIERCYTCNPYYHTPNDAVEVEPGYIDYNMVTDLVRSIVGYTVDQAHVTLFGDADRDNDVDELDLAAFQTCFGNPVPMGCNSFDYNGDNVVDCADWPGIRHAFLRSSGYVPALDAATFTAVLLGGDTDPAHQCIADMNLDGVADGVDIQSYVDAVTGP
ncbi:MAG: M28 family peptidase [Phycisphaerae bacterium]